MAELKEVTGFVRVERDALQGFRSLKTIKSFWPGDVVLREKPMVECAEERVHGVGRTDGLELGSPKIRQGSTPTIFVISEHFPELQKSQILGMVEARESCGEIRLMPL